MSTIIEDKLSAVLKVIKSIEAKLLKETPVDPYNKTYIYGNGLTISEDTYRDIQEKTKRISTINTDKYNFKWLN